MSKNLEIEFKCALTKEEMDQLLGHFHVQESQFFFQENVYFDTNDFTLQKRASALRVRIKNGTFELTLKEEGQIGHIEINQMITLDEYNHFLIASQLPEGEVKEQLRPLSEEAHFYEIARLTTQRATIPYSNQELFFDISTYYGHKDYELELETDHYEVGRTIFITLLEQFHIPYRKSAHKIRRALEYKAQYNQMLLHNESLFS